jgi:hypothetical protein
MVRTCVRLTEEQHRRLKRWSGHLGISMSEAIRRCVMERIGAEERAPSRGGRVRAALALAGKYVDLEGATGVSVDHDRCLAVAFRHRMS